MSALINKFSDFFRPHFVNVTKELAPKIEVDYTTFNDDMKPEYRKKWEELLAEIDPAVIKSRKWTNYHSGFKSEVITLNLNGVDVET